MGSKSLVVVESPAKAKTIKKYLGSGFEVKASIGHIKDLPRSNLGVDVDHEFKPTYEIIRGKKKVISDLVKSASSSANIYLATDPDREGEAIAWHIAEEIRAAVVPKKVQKKAPKKGAKKVSTSASTGPEISRILFHEITPSAIKAAIASPKELDQKLYEAQQARRVLDRLVGYKVSPLLWDKVRRGLSAGRVQTVAVRMICEREAEVKAFVSEEYWSIIANLLGSVPPEFEAKLIKIDGKDFKIGTDADAKSTVKDIKDKEFYLKTITRKERRRHPTPPFITSTLQQEAARKLGFTAARTMQNAQRLYEGIDLGELGTVGLITYMRTDSTRVSNEAIAAVRGHIVQQYGRDHLPEAPNYYKVRKQAQEAHEAIRPTTMDLSPEKVKEYLNKDQLRLYDLIWKRFVASQMMPAVFDQTTFDIEAGPYWFRATGQIMKFPGFISVYIEDVDDVAEKDEEENPRLPELKEGEKLNLKSVDPHQHFTQPPPRYTEASLVKALEEKGVGRPSTYAAILSTILEKEYVQKDKGRFTPTRLGDIVNELLVASFPEIFDVTFTAQMEEELDEVEEGKRSWVEVLSGFYKSFSKTLDRAKEKMKDIKRQEIETAFKCTECGSMMVIKWGKRGEFLACSNYPKCKNTKEFRMDENGGIQVVENKVSSEKCGKCGSDLIIKHGRFGEFLACSAYPNCKFTKSISTGVKCPDCGSDIVQKRTRRGKYFYGCGNYPKCTFALWNKPISEACPKCKNPYLVEKFSKTEGDSLACPKCKFKKPMV